MNRPPRTPLSPTAALNKAAALCARSEQASGDICAKLSAWGLTASETDAVIQRLKAEGYLDDGRYACAYCRDKMRFNGWGRIKVAFMLKAKGIGKSHIEAALAEVDADEYAETLRRLLRAKWREVRGKDPILARASMMRYAASRGFEPSVFYPIIDEVMEGDHDTDQ